MRNLKLLFIAALSLLSISSYSQDSVINNKKHQDKSDTKKFTCPMHADVKSDKPGSCPKCGMNLTGSKKGEMKKAYSCPMHADVISDKPGSCPKCGMNLTGSKKGEMKMAFSCPMHDDVKSDKLGSCPKCGMELKKSKQN